MTDKPLPTWRSERQDSPDGGWATLYTRVGSGNAEPDSGHEMPSEIAGLATNPNVGHILFGRFDSYYDYPYSSGDGHGVAGTINPEILNGHDDVRNAVCSESVYEWVGGLLDGASEFGAALVLWGDGELGVITLTYPDKKRDTRGASHTDYHVFGPSEVIKKAFAVASANPEAFIVLYHLMLPNADRSVGSGLRVLRFINFGDFMKPTITPVDLGTTTHAKPQRRLGKFGLRRHR